MSFCLETKERKIQDCFQFSVAFPPYFLHRSLSRFTFWLLLLPILKIGRKLTREFKEVEKS